MYRLENYYRKWFQLMILIKITTASCTVEEKMKWYIWILIIALVVPYIWLQETIEEIFNIRYDILVVIIALIVVVSLSFFNSIKNRKIFGDIILKNKNNIFIFQDVVLSKTILCKRLISIRRDDIKSIYKDSNFLYRFLLKDGQFEPSIALTNNKKIKLKDISWSIFIDKITDEVLKSKTVSLKDFIKDVELSFVK